MLIESISLQNYRVYQGNNNILFNYDHERNITIISGNNGFGKTSFLTSLIWCLYGKLMTEVDEKYKREILESGGYKKYCEKTINRSFLREAQENIFIDSLSFSVTIVLSRVYIPAIPCDNIEIKRTHNISNGQETLEILMDTRVNELTKEMGPEIFINDFILPREIAKFFFFDAEKIVSLAEMRSLDEKRQLGKAYSEVLGIKKYEDLKSNLENIRFKLRKTSGIENDEKRLTELTTSILDNDRLMLVYQERVSKYKNDIARKKLESDKFQEKLIREGSTITIEELNELKQLRDNAAEESRRLKANLTEMLDFAPFAIASQKLLFVYEQMLKEIDAQNEKVSHSFLQRKLAMIKREISDQKHNLEITPDIERKLFSLLENHLVPQSTERNAKYLLNFTDDESNHLLSILDNLKLSYSKRLKDLSQRQKVNQSTFSIVNSRLKDAETKENDLVIREIRKEKDVCEREILRLEEILIETQAKVINLTNEVTNQRKIASELTKKVQVDEQNRLKDMYASRLIDELSVFTKNLKQQKKKSLEANILSALEKLMHKADFIRRVEVVIGDDFIDIDLYDNEDQAINKEGLSKGEQQLYATAILKALVDESNIRFPLFIDSPLQKFDKQHAYNIVTEFYPTISEQVILFPLLEKELSQEEYSWLVPRVNKVFIIEHVSQNNSKLREVSRQQLFETLIAIE